MADEGVRHDRSQTLIQERATPGDSFEIAIISLLTTKLDRPLAKSWSLFYRTSKKQEEASSCLILATRPTPMGWGYAVRSIGCGCAARVGVASFHLWDAMTAGAGCRIQLVINL